MASALKNLSDYEIKSIPDGNGMKVAIVVSEWNTEVTEALYNGAFDTLKKHGVQEEDILKKYVPGSFELTHGALQVAKLTDVDAVICLGCVIQGGTPHFDYVCQGVTQGITELNIQFDIPFIFGVLTVDTQQQALDRCGGKHGNKGDEAAATALKMIGLKKDLQA